MNASMTFIHSDEENNFLKSITKPGKAYWIGLQQLAFGMATFSWMDGSEYNFTKWKPGQPDVKYSCLGVVIQDGSWWDEDCNRKLLTLCQIDLDSDYVPEEVSPSIKFVDRLKVEQLKILLKISILNKNVANNDLKIGAVESKISSLSKNVNELEAKVGKQLIRNSEEQKTYVNSLMESLRKNISLNIYSLKEDNNEMSSSLTRNSSDKESMKTYLHVLTFLLAFFVLGVAVAVIFLYTSNHKSYAMASFVNRNNHVRLMEETEDTTDRSFIP
ncbi:macrophage mannose receptor 1-like isoform X2 [Leptotrombidium deliense]|uniref:Macrophage mannose receptor 1-like isoform X2 n=1 Tax=Leptotrombidium deliense TaxID=299467 RepID=A0A443S8S1_9ACAR|nr:macrophage mannose receptor 1-like isoform X2 [Leptotrombidium deliense]